MSKTCELTGKRPVKGNSVSHSNRKSKRHFYPNLQDKRFWIPELSKWVEIRVSVSALRTIDKVGIYQFIKDQKAKGFAKSVHI
ncbi:MAG: 50S ribosomal protein L28 [Saprospiraceae bacterium]